MIDRRTDDTLAERADGAQEDRAVQGRSEPRRLSSVGATAGAGPPPPLFSPPPLGRTRTEGVATPRGECLPLFIPGKKKKRNKKSSSVEWTRWWGGLFAGEQRPAGREPSRGNERRCTRVDEPGPGPSDGAQSPRGPTTERGELASPTRATGRARARLSANSHCVSPIDNHTNKKQYDNDKLRKRDIYIYIKKIYI